MSLAYFSSSGGDVNTDPSIALAGPDIISILAACIGDLPLLPLRNLSYEKHLGSGTSFEVSCEIYNNDQEPNFTPYYVAVKRVNLHGSNKNFPAHYNSVMNELRVLTHPALKDNDLILPILAYGWSDSPLGTRPYLVVDYSDHGSLTHYLKKIKPTLWERQQLALDVAAGLQALHENNIIHGDVKPDNVLVFDTTDMSRAQMAKLADFGGAIFERDENQAKIYSGTALYKAPELSMRGKYQETGNMTITSGLYRADIYSFGITLWEILKSGMPYIEGCWRKGGETAMDILQRITEDEEDAVLIRARRYCEELQAGHGSNTLVNAFEKTFEVTLPDNPKQRADIHQVLITLAQGSQLQRPKSAYPLVKIHPPSKPDHQLVRTAPSQVDGVRRAFTGYRLVVQAYKGVTVGNSETEVETMKQNSKGGNVTIPSKPPAASSSSFLPMQHDILQINRAPLTPWNIQCDAAQQLHQEIPEDSLSTQTSKPGQFHACLQLAAYYHIGFGVKPSPEESFKYLNMSLLGDETGRAIYRRVVSALASDTHQHLVVNHQTEIDKLLEAHELDSKYFALRNRLQLHHAMQTLHSQVSGAMGDLWGLPYTNLAAQELNLERRLEDVHMTPLSPLELSNALTQACEHGDAEAALKLCGSLETFIPDDEKPSPLHRLVNFSDESIETLASALITGSTERPGPCRAHINTFPTTGTGIFFYPEHCMELFGTPLHWAVRTRNLKLVQILITLGADINARWTGSRTWESDVEKPLWLAISPLDVAVCFHLPEIVAELLDRGAERSGGSYFRQPHSAFNCIGLASTPFSRFIIHGANARQAVIETVQVLVDHGFEICATDANGYDPIMVALRDPDCELYIPEELITAGAQLNRSTFDDQSNAAIIVAQNSAIRRYRVATLELVSNHVTNINDLDSGGKNALHYAAFGGSGAAIEVLGKINGLDVDARTPLNQTALHLASTFGNFEAITSLLNIGANMELVDSSGITALQMACLYRQSDVAEALMKNGSCILFTGEGGLKRGSVLHFSTAHASSGDTILRRLIETHAVLQENQVINATDSSGWTAMHKATYYGDFDAVKALLEYGADASIKSITGRSPLDECMKLLKQIETRGLGIDHNRIRRRGSHAVASFVEYLREIERSLKDHLLV
ncbi:hypothetical protein IFR05_011452 [Cadophora sp. M221]|nr:hypothetical protein IFR05_011452 [Cadophora sp. M221]